MQKPTSYGSYRIIFIFTEDVGELEIPGINTILGHYEKEAIFVHFERTAKNQIHQCPQSIQTKSLRDPINIL
jgi:hypothetical protein